MFLFLLAYIGGVLTILSPCILPVLPFVFARADQPFLRRGLPLLLGMAATFAVIATLAAVGGGWAVQANEYGRYAAIALLALFGVTLLFPELSDRLTRPLVALGGRLSESADRNEHAGSVWPSLLLGVATGLLWAPCAGPVLGLILTGAALQGANVQTTLAVACLCRRRRDIAGVGAARRRQGLRRDEAFARRRRMDPARPRRRGAGRGGGDRFGPRHRIPDPDLARQHRFARAEPRRPLPSGGRKSRRHAVVLGRDGGRRRDDDERQRSHDGDERNPAGKGARSLVFGREPGGGAMMSANPSMAMSANAPTMAMNGTPAGKKDAEPQSSVVSAGGGAMMSANAPTMAMNANPAAMMKAAPAAAAAENLPVEGCCPRFPALWNG